MISHIVFDIDGTLTDGGISFSDTGMETKQFQAKDGLIIRVMPKLGFTTMFVTGRESKLTEVRARDLCVSKVFQGVSDKEKLLAEYMTENNLRGENFAYIGDDLNDYTAMKLCGFKACPADAAKEIREICDYVSTKNGGFGAGREICELILRKNNKYAAFLALWGAEAHNESD